MRNALLTLLFLLHFSATAQIQISGKVHDEMAKPIASVSVSYLKPGQKAILGFGRTAEDGSFSLTLKPVDTDSITLVFNHLSYAHKTLTISKKTAHYNVVLEEAVREIEEIVVKRNAITQYKDTLNYHVNTFTSPQDRVIGDIIMKLPGIEMQGGEIFYQGKPIQKYTVNNLDLMEGRYGIINSNLPIDAVKNVQIIENNQPIKLLDTLVFSDRASLNIELKKYTTTGTGKVGLGAAPALWLVNLTPMTFGKTFQMVNSFQTNNVGIDATADLKPFYAGSSPVGPAPMLSPAPSYTSLRNVNNPDFDQRRWLNNALFLTSTHILKKLKSGMEVKGSASYHKDNQKVRGITSTQYFTAQKTIFNSEEIRNEYRINALIANLLLEKNEKKLFLKNTLQFNKRWNSEVGNLLFNVPITQKREYTDMAFLNNFAAARYWGKQLISLQSTVEYHRTPQRLWISPGQFDSILNHSLPSKELDQRVLFRSFSWKNNLGFTRRIKNLRLSPVFGVNYNKSHLDSFIAVDQRKLGEPLYKNAISNAVLEAQMELGLAWENSAWKFYSRIPFSLNLYKIQTQSHDFRTTIRPNASLTYMLNNNNELSFGASGGNSIGGLNTMYEGYIVSQYRTMQRYEARLLQTNNYTGSISYRFKHILKANFAHLNYSYNQNGRAYTFHTTLDSLGRSTTQLNDQYSRSAAHRISGGSSKFIRDSKTTIKLTAASVWTSTDYLLNDVRAKLHNFTYSGGIEMSNSFYSVFTVDYRLRLGASKNRMAAGKTTQLTYSNHLLSLHYSPTKQHGFVLYNAFYRNSIPGQRNQYFMDATYRYTLKKWKTDLEFTAFNLLDNTNYVQQFSTTYELVRSSFELRPRQVFVSTFIRF